jgi:pyridoxamine 5'-phosphate oxidase
VNRTFDERRAPPHKHRFLLRAQLLAEPLEQFVQWYDEAVAAACVLPNAMTLATASTDAVPSARMVLLKAVDDRGFVFYTNSLSQKGRELAENPVAALLFHWAVVERQVRVTGTVSPATAEESDAYFASRSRGSRLAASASEQSRPIERREALAERVQELADRYRDQEVPRPPEWVGYVVAPHTIEFWQGGYDRLHDRFLYTRQPDGAWSIERLSP